MKLCRVFHEAFFIRMFFTGIEVSEKSLQKYLSGSSNFVIRMNTSCFLKSYVIESVFSVGQFMSFSQLITCAILD